MNNPKVSIFLISYNQKNYIRDAVNSCLNQDYENIEIAISDDGSTDGTQDILRELYEKNPGKIKLKLHEKNQGILRNSNYALSMCSGDLIAFLGGDDVLYPTKISTQVREFELNERLVFCYHPCHILKNGNIDQTIGDKRKDLVENFYGMISNFGAQVIPGPAPMVAAHAVPKNGFDSRIKTACDWLFFVEVCAKGDLIRVPKILAQYRKHDSNIGVNISRYADDFLKTLDIIQEKYKEDEIAISSVSKGRKRFILGILYNYLSGDKNIDFDKYLNIYEREGGDFVFFIRLMKNIPWISSFLIFAKKHIKNVI